MGWARSTMASEEHLIRPHSQKQEDLVFSDEDLTIAVCGTQWGKSQGGTIWFKRQTHIFTDESDNFVVAAPTYKILQQSIIPYFLTYFEGWGDYSKTDAVFKINGGGTVYFRTETDPDSIVGIPNVKAGWIDEAGKIRLYFWENYLARAAAKGARTLLTTSPYSLNWLYKDYIKPYHAGVRRPGVKVIQAPSWENPTHTLHDPVRREQVKASMDPRRFNMIFGGEFGRMQGLVYDCWDDKENLCEPMELPPGTRFFGGIDWGYTDPFVFIIRAITPDGWEFGISEFYKSGLTLPQQMEVVRRALTIWPVERIFCGTDQPGHIEEFNRNKLPAEGADTSKGSIRRGIDLHYEIIKTRRYKEFLGSCPHAMDERETYHYPEPDELGPDDGTKEMNPVGASDHVLDAQRYITLGTRHLVKPPKIRIPESTNPFDAIFKKKKTRAEKFS